MSYETVGTVQEAESEDRSEHVMLLKSMFSEWDDQTLNQVMVANDGNIEAAIDAILAAGSPDQFLEQQQAPPPQSHAPPSAIHDPALAQQERVMAQIQAQQQQQQQLPSHQPSQQIGQPPASNLALVQDMVMVTAPPGAIPGTVLSINHNGQPFYVRVPDGVSAGTQFVANLPRSAPVQQVVQVQQNGGIGYQPQEQQLLLEQQLIQQQMLQQQQQQAQTQAPPPQPKGRGSRVTLPEDFLRPPGWVPSTNSSGSGRNGALGLGPGGSEIGAVGGAADGSSGMTDEQLAILLQDELFLQELSAHPEFRQVQEQLHNRHRPGGGRAAGASASSGQRPAGTAASTGAAPSAGSWSLAMRNRMKAVGAVFTSRQRQHQGYGEVASSPESSSGRGEGPPSGAAVASSEESPFHWADERDGGPPSSTPDAGAGDASREDRPSADSILRAHRMEESQPGTLAPVSPASGEDDEASPAPLLRAPSGIEDRRSESVSADFHGFMPAHNELPSAEGEADALGPARVHTTGASSATDESLVEITFDDEGDQPTVTPDGGVGAGPAGASQVGGLNGARQVYDL